MSNSESLISKIKESLRKTTNNFAYDLKNILEISNIDDEFYDELEEALIMCDVGIETSSEIINDLKSTNSNKCKDSLRQIIASLMTSTDDLYDYENNKCIIFVMGINGVGKTTSVAKLANYFKNNNKKVLLACLDTYRAAAASQLKKHADNIGIPIIYSENSNDPGSILFDAISSYKAKDYDILLCDVSGRIHNNDNLMRELSKLNKIIDNNIENIHIERLLVCDAMSGQNAIIQAKEFLKYTNDINGVFLTKVDGSSKAGMAISIKNTLNIPIKYLGIGEKLEDITRFDAIDFANAMIE